MVVWIGSIRTFLLFFRIHSGVSQFDICVWIFLMCDLISRFGHPPELQVCVITTTTTTTIIIKEKRGVGFIVAVPSVRVGHQSHQLDFWVKKGLSPSHCLSLYWVCDMSQRERERERERALHLHRMLMVPHLCFKNIENPKPFFVCLSVTSNRSCSLGCGERRIAPV